MNYDEPETIPYSIRPFCPMSADAGQPRHCRTFCRILRIGFAQEDLANGGSVTTLFYNAGFDNPFSSVGTAIWQNGSGTFTVATPLPAALPLLAGGIGLFGLLGWRRKRNAAALAA
jgi:hypothetical protein